MEYQFTPATIVMMIIVLTVFPGGFLYFISKALRSK